MSCTWPLGLELSAAERLDVEVSLVNHRLLNVSVYGSLAMLKGNEATLSKTSLPASFQAAGDWI